MNLKNFGWITVNKITMKIILQKVEALLNNRINEKQTWAQEKENRNKHGRNWQKCYIYWILICGTIKQFQCRTQIAPYKTVIFSLKKQFKFKHLKLCK